MAFDYKGYFDYCGIDIPDTKYPSHPDQFGYTREGYDEWMKLNNVGYKNASLNGGYRESRAHEPHWADKLPGLTHKDDPIVMKVLEKVQNRSDAGMKKYGVSMARPDVTTVEWLRHAQEEALDLAVYLERAINDLEGR